MGDVAPNEDEQQADVQPDRRQFLGKAALGAAGAGVAWAAPQVISMQAAAAATNVLPILLTVQNDKNSGTTATVGGLGKPGSNAQLLVVVAPLSTAANGLVVTPSASTGPAWVPLITAYDSSNTTPGTTGTDGVGTERLVMYAWSRVGTISGTTVSVTLTGTGLRAGLDWRATVAEFGSVTSIADNPSPTTAGQGLAQGGGAGTTTVATGPQIVNSGVSTMAVFFSATDTDGAGTPPTGYVLADFNGFEPAHMVARRYVLATNPIPVVTGSFDTTPLPPGHVVSLHVAIKGT